MILLTVNQLLGTRDDLLKANQGSVCFATRLSLPDALKELAKYRRAYKQMHMAMALDFSLLSVSEIEDVDDETLEALNVSIIEKLHMSTTAE